MDSFLIDYLRSGKACVLVGSGPSNAMGYPTWGQLADIARTETKLLPGISQKAIDNAFNSKDYPLVFEEARNILGGARLIQILRDKLKPSRNGDIYKLIARWPVAIYLTTNYDDEIQAGLAEVGAAYISYSNSEDHIASLLPDTKGIILKLHGDLRSENGLILTTSQYRAITTGGAWGYWRTKMTSVFQMNKVIIIGLSLKDENFRHVLECAKQGAGVNQPICWITADVTTSEIREYLEKYRIRLIPYDNKDGSHKNLFRLLESISDFIPPRTTIHIQEQIAQVSNSPLGDNAAAPGFFVFNKLAIQDNYENKRIEIILAALQSVAHKLKSVGEFSLEDALRLSGWPSATPIVKKLTSDLEEVACSRGIIERIGNKFIIGEKAESLSVEARTGFDLLRERFKQQLRLKAKRKFSELTDDELAQLSSDIELAITGYFREGGLSLSSILFSNRQNSREKALPSSIIKFISEASAKYDSLLMRQAFTTISIDAFARSESAERDYLGRISQGFFAFHSLGVFGEVAIERLKQAKETVWLVDSNTQIPALALASPTNLIFADCFSKLRDSGVRLFTTLKLFQETFDHFWFAKKIIDKYGSESPDVIAAATGQLPYRRSNQFLQGFIQWQASGNLHDWKSYLYQVFEKHDPTHDDLKNSLQKLGVEVIDFQDWSGFSQYDFQEAEDCSNKIVSFLEPTSRNFEEQFDELYKKAKPEAEARVIILSEREGRYHILSDHGKPSPSWFISNTSILNAIDGPSQPITWQPDAFLQFAMTLFLGNDDKSAEKSFQSVLWGIAQSGLSILDERALSTVMGGIIDQATLSMSEQQQLYAQTLESKYSEPLNSVMERISPINRPIAAIQMAHEIAQKQEQRVKQLEASAEAARKRAEAAEKELTSVEKFRRQMEAKKAKSQRNARKQQAKQAKKKRRKKGK